MHKPLLLVPTVVLFALGAASSPAVMPQEGSTPTTKTAKAESAKAANESATRAKKIFEVDCALCHNSNGNGKTDLAKQHITAAHEKYSISHYMDDVASLCRRLASRSLPSASSAFPSARSRLPRVCA